MKNPPSFPAAFLLEKGFKILTISPLLNFFYLIWERVPWPRNIDLSSYFPFPLERVQTVIAVIYYWITSNFLLLMERGYDQILSPLNVEPPPFIFNSHGEGVQIMIAAKYWSNLPIFNERKSEQAHIPTLSHNLTMRHIVNGRISIHFFHINYCNNMIMTFLANRCQINYQINTYNVFFYFLFFSFTTQS